MNDGKLVLIEYDNPERGVVERRPGWLREGSHHFLIIQEMAEKADLYTYTIIPKGLPSRITKLRILDG